VKRTATIITILAIVGSVALGIIIGQLSGGSDGETLPTSDVGEERGLPSPTASLTATPGNMAAASPTTDQRPIATPAAVGTPASTATPALPATPVRPTPTGTATARATSTAVPAPSEGPSLGEIRQAPTMTPTLVPNPLPPATVTPTPSPPPTVAPVAAPSADDETSIVIRVP